MLVSDNPEPFWMVNLIKFFDKARYRDGRESDLTGAEANELYAQALAPAILGHNSFPELMMPVSVILTEEPFVWEQAAIVRYASRDAFLNIFTLNPDVSDAVVHKDAAVENTQVYITDMENETDNARRRI